jgi:nitrogen fixation NifU-like protein
MNPDPRDLYREVILDHSRRPRGFGPLPAANHRAEGNNPLCGDRVEVFLELRDGRIADIAFQGAGCAISTASASLMTEALRGMSTEEAQALFRDFQRMVTQEAAAGQEVDETLGKLKVFAGVSQFPMRVKCATLPWHTFEAALVGESSEPVSTETA